MNAKRILLLGLCLILICSCGTKKKKKGRVAYVDYESEYVLETETIDIPFRVENGVKYVQAKINGVSTDMVFDTGCSGILISPLEAQQLKKRGLISRDDILGKAASTIADGSIVEDTIINLKTLELSDGNRTIVCHNVITQVSSSIDAPVLLGNGVLDRVASFTIDNEECVIKFKLK